MKKFSLLMVLVILTGCLNFNMTPIQAVDRYFEKYKGAREDVGIVNQLDDYVDRLGALSEEQREEYRSLLERQYDFLTYDVKEERIDGDNATVTVQIQVYDYQRAFDETTNYVTENPDEFFDEEDNLDPEAFNDYLLSRLKDLNDTKVYTLDLRLKKNDEEKEWDLLPLTEDELNKIHGLYEEAE